MAETYVLLWSQKHNRLHIDSRERMYSINAKKFADNQIGDYVPLFEGPRHAVQSAAHSLLGVIEQRAMTRETFIKQHKTLQEEA